ncbi:Peptidoglycan deacetylase [Rhizobiaceae bacterium]|nr:Peptidoglycan deacetylase [Rhizobiaceae bacterium]
MKPIFPTVIAFDLDAETLWTGRNPDNAARPVLLSHGAFEIREALSPILAVLAAHGVSSTFFVPGATADRYPDAVRAIVDAGHEIASHGHGHRPIPDLDARQEEDELVRGLDSLEAVTGKRPTIWRSPSWEWSDRTLDLLLKHGITVSANFHDRLRPYRHERDGKPLPLVELPVQWHLTDNPYFFYGGQVGRVVRPASVAREVWEEEFSGLYERPGAYYHLCLHPQLIGHPGRLKMLDAHLGFVKGHDGVRFMTASEAAATVE